MNPNDTITLSDNTPESSYSGLAELPEVKDTMAWLRGQHTGGAFREMVLDDVIAERTTLPDLLNPKTLPEKLGETLFSDRIFGGSGEGMNKLGEAFYTIKDSYATAIENIPTEILRGVSATVKTTKVLPGQESAIYTLNMLDDVKASQDFDKILRDFRLGVDSNAFSNQVADVFGQMAAILTGAGALKGIGVAATTAGGIMEGLAEGGQYIATDVEAARQREGGIEKNYGATNLAFGAGYGVLAGLVGMKGVEASFLDKMGKFTGKEFIKGVAGETLEEVVQTGLERTSRRTENTILGTDTDYQTWGQDVLTTLKAGLLGGIGGATIGGIAFVNNRNRAVEILHDNFGLTKTDARALANNFIEMSAQALKENTTAMADLSPNSRVMKFMKMTLMQDGVQEKDADKVLAKIRQNIIKTQVKADKPLVDNEFFQLEDSGDVAAYVRNAAGVQAMAEDVVAEEKQAISERRAELEQQAEEQRAAETSEETEPVKQTEEQSTPVQLELNFLNAEENAINEAMGIKAESLPVQQNLLTKSQLDEIDNKIDKLNQKVEEIGAAKTVESAEVAKVGQALNAFDKPKQAKSAFAERVSRETGVKAEPVLHNVRDIKKAREEADRLVDTNEELAWDMLEGREQNLRGFLPEDIVEALKRKIGKITDPAEQESKLRRLITDYSEVATQLGQRFRILADDSIVNTFRDIANLERSVKQRAKNAVNKKANKIKSIVDKATKSERVMSDKKFWETIREELECK